MRIEPYLSENHQKEALSYAYLLAVASECGYACQRGPQPDMDSVDATIRAKGRMRAQIDVQLKATAVPQVRDGQLRFRVNRKAHDDLRAPRLIPLVLVVVELPEERDRWVAWSHEELTLRRRAWWTSLESEPGADAESVTLELPHTQMMSPDGLRDLMSQAARGRFA